MKQEDKQLLLKDLCARLLYGVILNVTLKDKYDEIVNRNIKLTDGNIGYIFGYFHWKEYKPYLRPMSSMTEEERKEYNSTKTLSIVDYPTLQSYDWLNAHHFDYRGLIEKGLAIAVTKENNPYKE